MATSSLSGFGDADDEFPPDMGDLDAVLPMTPAAAQIPAVQVSHHHFRTCEVGMLGQDLTRWSTRACGHHSRIILEGLVNR